MFNSLLLHNRDTCQELFVNHLGVDVTIPAIGGLGKVLITRNGPAGTAGTILWTCSAHAKLIREYILTIPRVCTAS